MAKKGRTSKQQEKTKRKHNQRKTNKYKKTSKEAWWKDKKVLGVVVSILVLTFITFLPSLDNEFTNWDDHLYVTENLSIQSFSGENLKTMVTKPVAANYHPITMLSFGLNYAISEYNPFSYHLVNLLVHLLNTFLVFYFLFLLTKRKWIIAGITALLFAIHPMHVESVAWVAERKDVLYTFFFLLGLITYLKYVWEKQTKFYVYTLLFFVLSVLSKPAAVVFPLVLLLLDFFLNRLDFNKIDKKAIVEKIPFFAISLLAGIATLQIQSGEGAVGDMKDLTILQRFMYAGYGFSMYIFKLLVPTKLSTFYPYPATKALPIWYTIAPICTLIILGLATWSLRFTKVIFFSVVFYLINLLLVLQFISVGEAIIADRYTYVPYIGLFFLIGYGVNYLWDNNKQQLAYVAGGLVIIASLVFALLSFNRTKVWANSGTLWSDVISKYENVPVAYTNRGSYYRKNKKLKEALADFDKAIGMRPNYFRAYNNRANVYFGLGQNEKAIADYTKTLELEKNDVKALSNRGAAYFQLKKYNEAMSDLDRALTLDPNHDNSLRNRGVLNFTVGRHEQAVKDFTNYLKMFPNDHAVWGSMGQAKLLMKQYQAAIPDFTKAIQIHAKGGFYYLKRSECYANTGQKAQALKDAQKAQQLGEKVNAAYLSGLQ